MSLPTVFGVVIGLFAFAECQHPVREVRVVTSIQTRNVTEACENLERENERLKMEVETLKGRLDVIRETEEEEDGSEESNESHAASRSHRRRRGAKCDAGTLAAWACAPQCVFKLKGLCGLSLKTICHC